MTMEDTLNDISQEANAALSMDGVHARIMLRRIRDMANGLRGVRTPEGERR